MTFFNLHQFHYWCVGIADTEYKRLEELPIKEMEMILRPQVQDQQTSSQPVTRASSMELDDTRSVYSCQPAGTTKVLYLQNCSLLYCSLLYCAVLYYTVLYFTILQFTVLYFMILHCTVLYCTVSWPECAVCAVCAVLCWTSRWYAYLNWDINHVVLVLW